MDIHMFLRTRLTKQTAVSSCMGEEFSYSDRNTVDLIPLITFTLVEKYITCNKKSSGVISIYRG